MNFKKKVSQKGVYFIVLLIALLFTPYAYAQQEGRVPTPPTFPRCEDKLRSGVGDRTHLVSGIHGIAGRGNFEGKDDVYSLSEGNFVQCFCPLNGSTGVQSNWWYINGLPLGRVDIDAYKRDGWVHELNGRDWNLSEGQYLVRNSDFQCNSPNVTSAPTNTQTITPTMTPAPTSATESSCSNLEVSPSEGTAPLTVRFTANGSDPKGSVSEYEFDFGDESGGQQKVVRQSDREAAHRYENPGTYTARLKIKDSQGNWKNGESNCKRTITVRAKPDVMGGTDTEELPEAGAPLSVFFGLMILAEAGYIVYKKYQLV